MTEHDCKQEETIAALSENQRRINTFLFFGNGHPPASVQLKGLRDGQAHIDHRFERQEKWIRGIALLIIAQWIAQAGFTYIQNSAPAEHSDHFAADYSMMGGCKNE